MPDYLAQSDPGSRILGRCDELAAISRTGSGVTRLYLTGEHRAAMALVAQWMREAGMEVHTDQAANVIVRYPPAKRESGYLLISSHIDSVIDAGKYDGPLGRPLESVEAADVTVSARVLREFIDNFVQEKS